LAKLKQPLSKLCNAHPRAVTIRRDWYFENLLSVWEECGGETHSSVKGTGDEARAGPLVQFLQFASEPVFRHCDLKLLTPGAAREIVRKLLAERKLGRSRD
jgi:hypothetical protein